MADCPTNGYGACHEVCQGYCRESTLNNENSTTIKILKERTAGGPFSLDNSAYNVLSFEREEIEQPTAMKVYVADSEGNIHDILKERANTIENSVSVSLEDIQRVLGRELIDAEREANEKIERNL